MFRSFIIRILISATTCVSCGGNVAYAQERSTEFTDAIGIVHRLDRPATRIAAVANFAADYLLSVGKEPIAITTTGGHIPSFLGSKISHIPNLGIRSRPDLELLRQSAPDSIVVSHHYVRDNARKYAEIARFVPLDLITMEDSFRAVRIMGTLTGTAQDAERSNAEFAHMLAEYKSRAPGGLSAAMLYVSGPQAGVYFNQYMTVELFRALGITNVIGPSSTPEKAFPFTAVWSIEDLLTKDPDILFVSVPEGEKVGLSPIWRRLKAVKTGRVYAVGVQWLEVHGPIGRRLVLQEIAHLAYPETFPLPDEPRAARPIVLQKP